MKSIILKASEPYITKVKEQIFSLEQALALYRLHNGFYPSTEQGLQALLKAPTNSPIPNHYQEGGYIKSIPQDVWGKPYIYRNYGDEIQIISYGLDGKEGGEGINSAFIFGIQEFKRVCNFSAPHLAMFMPLKHRKLMMKMVVIMESTSYRKMRFLEIENFCRVIMA